MRIFQGVTGQAGQPSALAKGLRGIGMDAQSYSIVPNTFGYDHDSFIDIHNTDSLEQIVTKISHLIDRFDVFHFHGRTFASRGLRYPSGMDLILLKLLGKRVYFHFRGSEVRTAPEFEKSTPYNYVRDEPELFTAKMDAAKTSFRDLVVQVCDEVFVVDEELRTYAPKSTVIPRGLVPAEWPFVGVSQTKCPIVVHAPSNRAIKGTCALLAAVDSLKTEGLKFDFRLIEKVSNETASKIYREADIIVDQLRIGWHGVLAVEGMALGKVVISYIREDLWSASGAIPIVNANPDTIRDRLREAILLQDLRQSLSRRGREYFLKVHDAEKIARTLVGIYARSPSPPSNAIPIAGFLDAQRKAGNRPSITELILRLNSARRKDGLLATLRLLGSKLRDLRQ